eukprot:COSAG02_NODE_422_length_22587_cov_10.209089_15_plen_278_part_00
MRSRRFSRTTSRWARRSCVWLGTLLARTTRTPASVRRTSLCVPVVACCQALRLTRVWRAGGSDGATMRFSEGNHGANAGLGVARDFLEPVKRQYPAMSYADLWILASYAAIEFMGGPTIPFTAGRKDATDDSACPPEHMLPDGHFHQGKGDDDYDHPGPGTAAYVRWVFNKMGFNDREMVCLIGAHALGRCHTNASGYDGPWTRAPETFSNEYFKLMLEDTWTVRKWSGPVQYENSKSGSDLMMLPADIVLVEDKAFRSICEEYVTPPELALTEPSR